MGELVRAECLGVGEVFFDPSRPEYGLREVTSIRTMRSVETYTVIDFRNVRSYFAGQINCIKDVEVHRVHPVEPEELADVIHRMLPGDHLTIFRIEDGVWA